MVKVNNHVLWMVNQEKMGLDIVATRASEQGNWTYLTKELPPRRGEGNIRRVAIEFYLCASIGEASGNSR